MAVTKIQPTNINTSATFNFANTNITSNLSVGGKSNLGPISNVIITGGSANYVLQTDGAGNLSWSAAASGSNISNGTSNVSIATSGGNVTTSVAGNANILVVTGTGANVSGTLSVSGNANASNIGTGIVTASGNITGANLVTGGVVSATGNGTFGNISGGNLASANYVSGTLTTAAQPNITSLGTLSSLVVSGNVTAANLVGVFSNGNSNVNIPAANGNVNISAAGNANIIVVTGTGANVNGTLSTSGRITTGAITLPNIDGSNSQVLTTYGNGVTYWANASGGNLAVTSDDFTSDGTNASFTLSVTPANINDTFVSLGGTFQPRTGYSLAGNVLTFSSTPPSGLTIEVSTLSGGGGGGGGANISNGNSNVNIATSGGNVTTSVNGNANILVVSGTGANIAGTLSVSGNSNLGPASNVIITGGSANYVLQTDGAGNLSWASAASGSNISNGTSNVSIATSGGNVTTSVAGNANILVVTGTGANVNGTLSVSGNGTFANVSGGNLVSANYLTGTLTTAAQPNVTSLGTLSSLTATGNIVSGNLTTGGALSVTGNANVGNLVTGGGSGGNISGANVITANTIVATSSFSTPGNITYGGYITTAGTGGNISGANVISANTFTGVFANGNSNVNISAANGNVTISAIGNANIVVVTGTGANINGNLAVTGNIANTRINPRVANNGATTSGTITPTADTADQYNMLGLNGTVTIAVPSGTFVDGQKLLLRLKDSGSSQILNWTTVGANSYRVIGVNLPTSTSASKTSYVGCVYNSTDVYWDVVAVGTEL